MKSRVGLLVGLVVMLAMTTACAESGDTSTTGPSSLSPFLAPQIDGVWGGRLTLTGVTGGAGSALNAGGGTCVTAAFGSIVGETVDHSLSISQSGTDLKATLVSTGSGLACAYTGRIGSGTAVLDAATCGVPKALLCQGATYELDLVGSSVTASFDAPVNVTTLSGTAAHSYNLFVFDSQGQRVSVGGLVTNHRFTGLRRR